jgi:mono/diheme cytochrome c family protein
MLTVFSPRPANFLCCLIFAASALFASARLFAAELPSMQEQLGAELFQRRCVICHGSDGMGEGVLALILPNYPNTNLMQPRLTSSLSDIRQAIDEGPAFRDSSIFMPPWRDELEPREIDALAMFVQFLRSEPVQALALARAAAAVVPPTPRIGHALFLGRCSNCHGHDADGSGRRAAMLQPPPADLIHSGLSEVEMRRVIKLGGEATGRSPAMPPWGREFSDTEIEAILLHLRKMRETYRSRQRNNND